MISEGIGHKMKAKEKMVFQIAGFGNGIFTDRLRRSGRRLRDDGARGGDERK